MKPMVLGIQMSRAAGKGKLNFLKLLLLASIGVSAIIGLIMVSDTPDSEPVSVKIALRINEEITVAHIWTQDYARGSLQHNGNDIEQLFNWITQYIQVVINGGEFDGTVLSPLDTPEELQEMQEIQLIVDQMKVMTFNYLAQNPSLNPNTEFDREYDKLFLELVNHTNRFSFSSLHFLQRYHRRFDILQIVVLVLGMGFALAVFGISRKSDMAQAEAWDQVQRIDQQRQLDITDLKMSELKLKREKEKAQLYLDMARVIFVAMDSEGIVQMINHEGCKILGYPEEDIVGKKWMENFVPLRFHQSTQAVSDVLLSGITGKRDSFVNPILTSDGKEALIAWYNTPLYDDLGAVTGHLSSGTDITRRDKREKALQQYQKQLQSLASQLAQTEDHLRQEIAAGLHDSIGQNLAALKLSVDIMRLNMGATPVGEYADQAKALASVSLTIDEIVHDIWSLSFQLCPPGLQESGIVSALDWLITQYNQEYDCIFHLVAQDSHLEIDRTKRGQLFQMIRELLINTIKHGSASEVDIVLAREGGFLLATVTDNGKGFDANAVMATAGKSAGFGLFSIRERLAFISGKLEIVSMVGQGTKVVIHFPMEESNPQNGEMSS